MNDNPNIRKMQSIEMEEIHSDFPYELLLFADESKEAIDKYLPNCRVFLIKKDGQTVGVFAIQMINSDTLELKNIAIMEALQGKGYGKLVIDWIKDHFQAMRFKNLLAGTGDASLRQIQFYEKCGFEKFETRKSFFLDNYPEPIYENGVQLKDMVVLKTTLEKP